MNQNDQTLAHAVALHQAGRLHDAAQRYRQVLAHNPKNFDALRNFGVCQLQLGNPAMAAELLTQALKLKPRHADALFELGQALYGLGQFQPALDCLDKSIKANPVKAEAHSSRGIMLSALGRHAEAVVSFEKAVRIRPGFAQAHSNLGNGLAALGRHEEALASHGRALGVQPNLLQAHVGRVNALLMLKRHEDALAACEAGLAIHPTAAALLNGRGSALTALHRKEEALGIFERALALDPNNADVHHNLGNLLVELERIDEGLQHYEMTMRLRPSQTETLLRQGTWLALHKCHQQALDRFDQLIAIQPHHFKAHTQRGKALAALGRHQDAIAAYRQALAIQPDHAGAYIGMADALRDLGHHEEGIAALEAAIRIYPNNPDLLSGLLFTLNYVAGITPAEILARHRQYGELLESPLRAHWQAHNNSTEPNRPLRIGFVSGDLRRHPVGFFMESTFQELGKNPLELYAYANQPKDDDLSERIRPCFKVWRDIWEQADDTVAEQIRADGIDILVDLSGHTAHHRLPLFARKPAPVQVTYLGYSGTTGLTAMDYILGNRWLMPNDEPNWHSEAPCRLPDTQLCFTPPALEICIDPPPVQKNGYITFGNYNNLAKMNDASIACWARILNAVPNSRLALKAKQFDGIDVPTRVQARFASCGIAADRLILLGHSASFADHMKSYGLIDIALDPFPYNGTTTTMDCLWMGVPVLTLYGERYIDRVGASILQTLDLPDWIARDEDDYVARATALAADSQALATLRTHLRQRFVASPLCDAPRFATHLEQAFRDMWQAWCANPVIGFAQSR